MSLDYSKSNSMCVCIYIVCVCDIHVYQSLFFCIIKWEQGNLEKEGFKDLFGGYDSVRGIRIHDQHCGKHNRR